MNLLTVAVQCLTALIHLLNLSVQLATVPKQMHKGGMTFTTPPFGHPSKTGGELNKKLGPAERRVGVKACGQKHRSALSFASFWSSKRKKKKKSSALVVKKKLPKKK
jgi:hypothetical protein